MYIYLDKKRFIVETNVEWALPYWTKRKQINDKITWEFIGA
jgi:hypothetical protein